MSCNYQVAAAGALQDWHSWVVKIQRCQAASGYWLWLICWPRCWSVPARTSECPTRSCNRHNPLDASTTDQETEETDKTRRDSVSSRKRSPYRMCQCLACVQLTPAQLSHSENTASHCTVTVTGYARHFLSSNHFPALYSDHFTIFMILWYSSVPQHSICYVVFARHEVSVSKSRYQEGLESRDAVLERRRFISVSRKSANLSVSVSGLNVSSYKLIFNDRSSLKLVPVIS